LAVQNAELVKLMLDHAYHTGSPRAGSRPIRVPVRPSLNQGFILKT
jgi:hypothetical protein